MRFGGGVGVAAASVATASSAVVVATSLAAKKDICAISLVHSDGAICELSSAQLPRNAESHNDRRQCTKEKEGVSEMKTGRNRSRNVWSQQL